MIWIDEVKKFKDLREELHTILSEDVVTKSQDLDDHTYNELSNLFSSKETNNFIQQVTNFNTNSEFNYYDLCELNDTMDEVVGALRYIKERVDMDIFFKDGYTLDIKKFKEKFEERKLYKKFPNFNFKRLLDLYNNPPSELNPYYTDKETILINEFVFRKYVIGIIQMVLDEMDLVVAITGGEGTGKSTHASQLMYMTWWIIKELGIADYKFNLKDMFFNTLEKLRLKEDDLFNEPFRILTLDEGNELHRQNWRDEEVQTFFQRLRRERYNQRIKFICIPVLGELMPNVVLSRVNFVTEMVNTNEMKTGSLNKGRCNFYIIPRGDMVYSAVHKKDLSKGEIKTIIYENLKDKNYLKGIPNEIVIKSYRCSGTWAFPRQDYIMELKETNKIFQVKHGLKLTDLEAFYLYMARISLKAVGLDSKDVKYATLNKFMNRLKKYFEEDPDKLKKYSLIMQRKEEEKNLKNWADKGLYEEDKEE